MQSGLAGIYPGTVNRPVPVPSFSKFDVATNFQPGRMDGVPIMQLHPQLTGFIRRRVERAVPERVVTLANTTTNPPRGARSVLEISPVQHLYWAHFFHMLLVKELEEDHASMGLCLLGTPRLVVWAYRDAEHRAWVITCCHPDFPCEWHPGDEFALYQ